MRVAWFYISALLLAVNSIPTDGQLVNCFAPPAPACVPACQPPIIVKKSTNLNSILPFLIMMMNDNSCPVPQECGCCESQPQNIPIPYPIPVPVNSPFMKY